MHYGQIVQSHALHFFHLASPDLLLGFESEVAQAQHRRRRRRVPRSRQAGRADPQIRPGSHPPHRRQAHSRHRLHSRRHEQGVDASPSATCCAAKSTEIVAWSREAVGLVAAPARDTAGILRPLRRVARQHDGAGRRRRRARLLSRRPARQGRRRRDDFRPRRLLDLSEALRGRDQTLELYEVPAHPLARRGERLVSRRPVGARADLPTSCHLAARPKRSARRSAPSRRQAGPRRAALSTGRA